MTEKEFFDGLAKRTVEKLPPEKREAALKAWHEEDEEKLEQLDETIRKGDDPEEPWPDPVFDSVTGEWR